MNPKKKLLMLSYSFPPIKGIGTLRNFNMADQFQKHFEVKIFSTKNRFVLPLEDINVDKFDISYLQTLDYKTVKGKRFLNADKKKKKESEKIIKKAPKAKNQESRKVIFIRKLINSFPFNLFFGEGGLIYILHGLYLSRSFSKKGYNTIYSSFRPISDHYLAYCIKKLDKKKVWIADYRDLPYYDEVNKVFLLPKFQLYLLKKIIKKADYILTISEGLKSFFEAYNPNVIVLRNGMSNLIERKSPKEKQLNKFTITYTGTLYEGRRDPSILFSVIEKLIKENKMQISDLNLVYAGKEGDLWETLTATNNLSTAVINYGMVDLQKSLELQNSTHINLLLSWSSKKQKGILTGKLYEYICAKKFIMLIINGDKDLEFEQIINDLSIGETFYNNNEKLIENYLEKLYLEWKQTKEVKINIDESNYKKYFWGLQFDEFIKRIS